MTGSYALVGCGAAKMVTSGPVAARDLYLSTYFQKKAAFAEKFCNRWWVLSAKYAAIPAANGIQTYERHIDDVDPERWRRNVYINLRADDSKWVHEDTELFVLAGQKYIEPIRPDLDDLHNSADLGVTVRYPFKDSSGIGDQLSWLSEQLEKDVATIEPEEPARTKTEQTTLLTDGGRA